MREATRTETLCWYGRVPHNTACPMISRPPKRCEGQANEAISKETGALGRERCFQGKRHLLQTPRQTTRKVRSEHQGRQPAANTSEHQGRQPAPLCLSNRSLPLREGSPSVTLSRGTGTSRSLGADSLRRSTHPAEEGRHRAHIATAIPNVED